MRRSLEVVRCSAMPDRMRCRLAPRDADGRQRHELVPLATGLVLASSAALAAIPAQALPGRDLYMVTEVAVFDEDCAHGYPCKILS